ncbi:hypothetical protein [Bacteroides ihuae]|uniref:hypothetical protein n=1 Tax=Bacteroides ihuae TaxID=1852362 RepID=UPI0008DAB5B2|nr:hypothetical protein [Bacteroides ihuae]
MIAANIGKVFLEAYNEKHKSNYSAKEFFVEKYFHLFFDEEKYMQWVTNSPFVQGIKKGVAPTPTERKLKLEVLIDKIANNEADASIAIGFPSLDITATTSGQITNMALPLREEEVYLSWIGSGFGIGVQSGLSMFFDNKQILLDLYDGWTFYRGFLNKIPLLRGNQINTWNGQWLAHRYNKVTYDELNPTASFDPFATMKNEGMEITTQSWIEVLIGIAYNYPNSTMTAYVYSLGQTNITIGFIPFELPKIRSPFELFRKYFSSTKNDIVRTLFGTAIGFTKACQMGAIGVNALEPKGFRECLERGTLPKYNNTDEEKKISFNTYQIWLLSMLNNEQLWDESLKIAATLSMYSASDKNAKKTKSQEVTNLLVSVNKKQFIEGLTSIVKSIQDPASLLLFSNIASLLHTMPIDNVPYFLTLIRFQYAVVNKQS